MFNYLVHEGDLEALEGYTYALLELARQPDGSITLTSHDDDEVIVTWRDEALTVPDAPTPQNKENAMPEDKNKSGNCVRRALIAALKHTGVDDDFGWIPPSINKGVEIKALIADLTARYPWLHCHGLDTDDHNPDIHSVEDNEPIVIFYEYHTDQGIRGHAVFLSDAQLMQQTADIRVGLTITGWNNRRKWLDDEESYKKRHTNHLATLREIVGEGAEVLDLKHYTDGFWVKCSNELGALRLAHFFRHAAVVLVKKVLERSSEQLYAVQVMTEGGITNPFAAAEIIADAKRLQRDANGSEAEWAAAAIQGRAEELMSYIMKMKP